MLLRIALAQINPTVGAIEKNAEKILAFAKKAVKEDCDLVVFPELALTGYPPEDLLLKPHFVGDNMRCIRELSKEIKDITAVVGFVFKEEDIYNSAAVIHRGAVAALYHKMYLPNYGVFDEERYFQAGRAALNFTLNGITIGVGICEDIWYPEGPARVQALAGAHVIVNINASPYHFGKLKIREEMITTRALDNEVVIAYNNMVGGQDELVFDGQGMIIDEDGNLLARGMAFREDLIIKDLNLEGVIRKRLHDTRRRKERAREDKRGLREITLHGVFKKKKKSIIQSPVMEHQEPMEEVLDALILGTQDYVRKNGFTRCVIGISGGVDSALVAAIGASALGKKNITGVFMPSRYSSAESKEDAQRLAKNLGIELLTIAIDDIFGRYLTTMKGSFKKRPPDVTEENIQARIRGNILMALSNKFGWLVLTTGNKSEMSVGYATLYGDMAGGFAIIKDVPKTMVYAVSRHINKKSRKAVIPKRVLDKAPSAELRPNQRDDDTLPPYEILDPILKAYVEDDKSFEEIACMGFKKAVVRKVICMVDRSEYKRRQSPPGVKITPRALGKDRRMPITNGYRER